MTAEASMFLLNILWFAACPIIMLLAIGCLLDIHFPIHLDTYDHLLKTIVLPIFVFASLYLAPLTSSYLLLAAAWLLFFIIAKILYMALRKGTNRPVARTLPQGLALQDLGLLGIPFILILYRHAPFMMNWDDLPLKTAVGAAAIIYVVSSFVSRFLSLHRSLSPLTLKQKVLSFLSIPSLYALLAVIVVKELGLSLEHTFLWPIIVHFNGALVIFILISIGIAFHRNLKGSPFKIPVPLVVSQFVIAPVIGLILLHVVSLPNSLSQVFLLFSVLPVSSVLPALPFFKKESRSSLFAPCTLISLISLTIWAIAAEMLFPILH